MVPLLIALAAAAPVHLDHQARLLDATGAPIQGNRTVVVALFDGADAGATELDAIDLGTVGFEAGYASLVLPVDSADLLEPELWVEHRVDGVALQPRQRVSRAPLAAVADTARGVPALAEAGPCVRGGALAFDSATATLRVCAGGSWLAVAAGRPLAQVDGAWQFEDGEIAVSCLDYVDSTGLLPRPTGVYRIHPPVVADPFKAYCDMDTDGGGWTLISSNADTAPGGLNTFQSFPSTTSVAAGTAAQAERAISATGFSIGSNVSGNRKTVRFELTPGFTFTALRGSWVGYGRATNVHHDDNQAPSTTWLAQSDNNSVGSLQFGTPSKVLKTGGQWGGDWNDNNATQTFSFDERAVSDSVIRWSVIDQSTPEWVDFRDIAIYVR